MTRRGLAFALATVASVVAIACASFEPSTTAAASDAGGDGLAGDAGTDASHTFFDDFDDGPFGAKWTGKNIGAPAVLELSTEKALSPPNALHAYFPDNTDSFFNAQLSKRFDRSTKSLMCRVMLFVEDHSEEATPSILNVKFRVPSSAPFGNTEADLSIKGTGSSVSISQDDAGEPTYPFAGLGLMTGRWIEIAMKIDADAHTVDVTVDGASEISGNFPAAVRPNEGFDVRLGAFAVGKGDSARFRFDDFWCDVVFD